MYYVYFMTKYHSHGVQSLSNNQKVKLATHFFMAIKSWILMVNDEFILTRTQINRVKKAILLRKGSDIKISKTQISHILKKGLGMQNSPFASIFCV